jgi:hypothetical protein
MLAEEMYMATVTKRVRKGKASYQVKIRIKGFLPQSATFERKTDADRWGQRIEADLREGKYFPSAKAKKQTVSQLIDQYLENLKATNNRRYGDVRGLLEWWKAELGHIILSDFRGEHVLKCQQKLLGRKRERKNACGDFQTLSPATVIACVRGLQPAQPSTAYQTERYAPKRGINRK